MMRLHARTGTARFTALGLAGLVSVLGVGTPSTSSAQTSSSTPPAGASGPASASSSSAHAGHAGHGATASAEQLASCRRWTPPVGEPQRVRKSADKLIGFGLTAFRDGVTAMKARPATDPTSWTYQAAIHGTYTTPVQLGWNSCQHESYLFVAWHRMYLYFFERILRKASGVELTVSYWPYAESPTMPMPFINPARPSNPLWLQQRDPAINAGGKLDPGATSHDGAFDYTNFSAPPFHSPFQGPTINPSFGGQVVTGPTHFSSPPGAFENVPHNAIHNLVGGKDGGYMADPNYAALDPIFWLHHANIDRLWSQWIAKGGGRVDPPPSDAVWRNTPFVFFDENGQCVTMTGDDIITTATQLNYRYDDEPATAPEPTAAPEVTNASASMPAAPTAPAAAAEATQKLLAEAGTSGIQLSGHRQAIPMTIKAEQKGTVAALSQGSSAGSSERVMLELGGFTYGRGAYYKLFLNLPASEHAPSEKSPYFIGLLAPFSMQAPEGDPNGLSLAFDLTPVIARLAAEKLWKGDALTVTFVPGGVRKPGAPANEEVVTAKISAKRLRILSVPAPTPAAPRG